MGLCKCSKKKVTNLFCFEHRVNVCEHCLVESHASCIVQSYLAWLQDSDFDTNCPLCLQQLSDRETVRLQCLHLFHWDCIDTWARRFPANTAPAGYRCPQCSEQIFPAQNQVSPRIDKLKAMLQRANWARAGLGLSLLPEVDIPSSISVHSQRGGENGDSRSQQQIAVDVDYNSSVGATMQNHFAPTARKPAYSHDESIVESSLLLSNIASSNSINAQNRDEDLPENKYKRRSAIEWFQRWLRSRSYGAGGRDPLRGYKRTFLILLILILALMTLITILTRVVHDQRDDPMFDPMANPNIHIAAGYKDDIAP